MTTVEAAASDFRRSMAVMSVFSLASNLLLLTLPLYLLQIYDRVLPSHSSETLVVLTLIAILALIVLGLIEVVRSILANRAAARLDTRLSDLTLRTVIRFGTASGGNVQPLRDIAGLRGLVSSKLVFGLLDLPFASIFIGLMYFIHPDLFWITLAGAAVVFALAVANQLASDRAVRQQMQTSMDSGQRAEHLARNADSVLAMGMLTDVVNRWGMEHALSLRAADISGRVNAWFSGLSRTLRLGLQVAILGYGAHLVLTGEMTAGLIFAASLISGRGLQPIDQTIGSWRQLISGWQSWKRLRRFLEAADTHADRTDLPAPRGKLEVVELLQPNPADHRKPPVLSRVSFTALPGEVVAVVGPSGAGKSTLARIIVGAERQRAGHVRIDGHDIANWNPEALGRHIGYLAQDVELIPGTIAENIARFDPGARDDAVVAAAGLAHAEDLIKKMPKGYDTLIGPGGVHLSGGEKQRLALARAFYGKPRLMVLDEPNANLDPAGEEALIRALEEARRQAITVLIITQRETVLGAADKIMRLVDGAIAEFGDRDEILARALRGGAGAMRRHADPAAGRQYPATSSFLPQLRASVGQEK